MRLLDSDLDVSATMIVTPDACIYSADKTLTCLSCPRSLELTTAMNMGPFCARSEITLTSVSTMMICASSSWFQELETYIQLEHNSMDVQN